jgi:hypothetical protein
MKSFFKISLMFIFLGCNFIYAQNYNEILGRPTDTSITVSVMFDQVVDVYIEYGITSGVYSNTTATITNTIDTPDEIELQDLLPNTKYYYKTRYRLSGSGSFSASPEHTFYTQRAAGSTFTFTVESDVHLYDKKGCDNEYKICLANQAADHPDFMIDMGDTYGDDRDVPSMTNETSDSLHKYYRPLLGNICHSIPFYFCMGNHEGEFDYYLLQSPPDNIAVWGTLWRKFYYPNPYANNFYSGNTDVEGYGMGNPENYYSWTWGDALFVVLDAYRYQSVSDTTAKPQKWDWTLGFPQYTWFKNTLEGSSAKYKFVFIHQLRGQGRGGVLDAPYYEWGGYDGNGNWLFDTKRPGWDKPIHQLMVDNGVNILFHGHDHLFAFESLDSLIYLEVPMPSDSTYQIGMLANADAYVSDTLDGSGHIRVTVSPICVQVDYVRAYLPADTASGLHHNGEVAFSYTIGNCTTAVDNNIIDKESVEVFPNPARDNLTVSLSEEIKDFQICLINTLGQTVLQTDLKDINVSDIPNGIYFLKIKTSKFEVNKKIIICR